MGSTYRLGLDVGGTFTDGVLLDEATGETTIVKVPTTPRDPSEGFLAGALRIVKENGVPEGGLAYIVHGTTIATNAILENKIARTALLVTAGFRDILEIARQIRPGLYDINIDKPKPLVPRELCLEIPERLDFQGNVLVPLDRDAVSAAAATLRAQRVEAVVICFLHSYQNAMHERAAADVLRAELPEVFVCLSSDICPEYREYVRASTAVINAGVMPIVSRYLDRLESSLAEHKLPTDVRVMESNGGILPAGTARQKPVYIVESGPAAGVIVASELAKAAGFPDVISLDMGGTTAKVGLIEAGQPKMSTEYEVGAAAVARTGLQRASGYPIKTPVIDLVEIGSGGGSIAWIDSGGGLRVGPQSAGAEPGPVCYARGGAEPTVTDANLVLGRLNPDYFLGGEMRLDADAARRAVETRIAKPLGLSVLDAANGIIEIANANMLKAIRVVSVQRGYDPREFALVAFGGAAPLHVDTLARELDMRTTLVPLGSGAASALGLLFADLRHEYMLTRRISVDGADLAAINAAFAEQGREGEGTLRTEGIAPADIVLQFSVDARFVGQSHELQIPVRQMPLDEATLRQIAPDFRAEHRRVYGYASETEPVEIVNLRLAATGRIPKPRLRELPAGTADASAAVKGERPVFFAGRGELATRIYDRYRFAAGNRLEGPAVVEERDSTALILPGSVAEVDRYGNLIVRPA